MKAIFQNKAAFTELRIYAFAQKNTDMRIKKNAYAYKIPTLVGLFYIAFYRTCMFQHAYIRMRFFTLGKE